MTSGMLVIITKMIWIIVIVLLITSIIFLIMVLLRPFAYIFSVVYIICRNQWIMHRYAKADSPDKKLTVYVGPDALKVQITGGENNIYKLYLDGDIKRKIKIIITADSLETFDTSEVRLYLNGKLDNSRIYKLKDLPHDIPERKQVADFQEDDDSDGSYQMFFQNEVESYRIWFQNTHYKDRYWGRK